MGVDLAAALAEADPLGALLPAIQQAAEAHAEVCLVGGAVRDLLLKAPHLDIDLAVEGDSLRFARELASGLGGEVVVHERFQTASVRAERPDVTVDVAATRTESYPTPGALPQVDAADLEQDLSRRDFTINAMAASLKRADLGRLHDPFAGLSDLRTGLIRVLHEHSFSDDPTRLLRALRYAARLGFEIEPQTLAMARAACASGLVGRLSSGRVQDELVDLLNEPNVDAALAGMHELGLDRALHPRLDAGERARQLIAAMLDALPAASIEGRVEIADARLAALCLEMSAQELETWLDRLQFPARRRQVIVEAATLGPALGSSLVAADQATRSRLHALLADRSPEAIALAIAGNPAAAASVSLYVNELEPVSLEIGGDDLLAEGIAAGPELGRALRETLRLKLDGLVSGHDQELAAALQVLKPASD
jgi:tRNA nucleotidyltransferase (CCA-adding enzyme)